MPSATIRGRRISWESEHYPGFWTRAERGDWESHTFAIVDRYVTPETIVLDIGAHIGAIALYAAHVAARVIAFEPDPISRAMFVRNVAANPDAARRVDLVPRAVNRSGGRVLLGSKGDGGDSQSSCCLTDPKTTWEVDAISPAQVVAMLPSGPVFVKIDIEGGEYDVVPGARELWARDCTAVLISTHPQIMRAAGQASVLRRRTRAMFQALERFTATAVGSDSRGAVARLFNRAGPRDWLFTPHSAS